VPSGDRFKQSKETLRIGLKLLTAPNKEFDIGTSVIERATTSEALKEKWAGDPLNRMNLTPKELLTFQSFMNANYDSAKQITKTPVLFVQGCKDQLVRPEGTVQLFNSLQTKDREIELIHDKEHLIFEEGQFDDHVLDIVDKWLVAHISNNKQLTSNK
jgi:alpha-beta hydrolase superfamily lysophospholipase